jgi:hypothetical protein
MSATTGVFTATNDPSALLSSFFVGFDVADANFQIMHNDASGACTKIDLGANFPKTSTVDLYEIIIRSPSNGSEISYQFSRLNTVYVAGGSVTSDLPANTQLMSPQVWCNTGTGTSAVGIDIVSQYIETDY